MSFIYSLTDTWNNGATVFNSIQMNVSNGFGGAPVGSALSRIINLLNNGASVFSVDANGVVANAGALNSTGAITGPSTNVTSYNNILAAGVRAVRFVCPGNLQLYVSTTGNDTTGDGSIGAPWRTVRFGCVQILSKYDCNGFTINLNVSAGTFTETVNITNAVLGNILFNIVGAGSGSTIIQGPNANYTFVIADLAAITLFSMTVQGVAGCVGLIRTVQSGICDVSTDVVLGVCNAGAMLNPAKGGYINILANMSLTGNAINFVAAEEGGYISLAGTITIALALTFTITVSATYGGEIHVSSGFAFAGAGVAGTLGTRYAVNTMGILFTSGTDPSSIFPGNVNGQAFIQNGLDVNPNNGVAISATGFNFGMFGTSTPAWGATSNTVFAIANGTAPITSPAGIGQIYVEAGALKYRGAGGTITSLAAA